MENCTKAEYNKFEVKIQEEIIDDNYFDLYKNVNFSIII